MPTLKRFTIFRDERESYMYLYQHNYGTLSRKYTFDDDRTKLPRERPSVSLSPSKI